MSTQNVSEDTLNVLVKQYLDAQVDFEKQKNDFSMLELFDAPSGLDVSGMSALWFCFVIFAFSTFYFFHLALSRKGADRKFEFITIMITGFCTISYLVMASGFGTFKNGTRIIFYARYLEWFFTTPFLLWDLMELAGAPGAVTIMMIGVGFLMVLCWAIGALLVSYSICWVFFTFGCLIFIYIITEISGRMSREEYGFCARLLYIRVARLTIITWTLYPVLWVLCEWNTYLDLNLQCILYGLLDLFSKCLFGFIILSNRPALNDILNSLDGFHTKF